MNAFEPGFVALGLPYPEPLQAEQEDVEQIAFRQSRTGFLARALDTYGMEREALIARQEAEKDAMKAQWRGMSTDSRTRSFGTIVQAASYRKTAEEQATPRERA